jgi:hypothetical protein
MVPADARKISVTALRLLEHALLLCPRNLSTGDASLVSNQPIRIAMLRANFVRRDLLREQDNH